MFALSRIGTPLFAIVCGFDLARPGVGQREGYQRIALRLARCGLLATAPFIVLNQIPFGWYGR
jgi:hypothetical protein